MKCVVQPIRINSLLSRRTGRSTRAARSERCAPIAPHVLFTSAMRGAPARAIQELAGCQDFATTQQYMHLRPAALDSAIRLLDASGMPRRFGDILETADR